jgi:hypothetical protein
MQFGKITQRATGRLFLDFSYVVALREDTYLVVRELYLVQILGIWRPKFRKAIGVHQKVDVVFLLEPIFLLDLLLHFYWETWASAPQC